VAKKSTDKLSIGGRKYAMRRRNADGVAEAEIIGIGEPPASDGDDRDLLLPLVQAGEVVGYESLASARDRHRSAVDELPLEAHKLSRGEPAVPTDYLGDGRRASTNPFAS
jgi:nicotinate phosphoribosyltransferase